MSDHKIDIAELKRKVAFWEKNVQTLEASEARIEPHAKPEYQQLMDSLIVKLSLLQQSIRDLMAGEAANKRTQRVIKKNLAEMEKAFMRAMSLMVLVFTFSLN
jgi:hypothetical protein